MRAKRLPFALLALNGLVGGGVPVGDLLGIAAAYCAHYLVPPNPYGGGSSQGSWEDFFGGRSVASSSRVGRPKWRSTPGYRLGGPAR